MTTTSLLSKMGAVFISVWLCVNIAKAATASSTELMCRNKAKEIAAETYKDCVTEVRQGQVKNLRKEYEDRLTALKSHYDAELKKISSGSSQASVAAPAAQPAAQQVGMASSDDNLQQQNNKPSKIKENYIKRSSGAREIPMKEESKDQAPAQKSDLSNNTDSSSVEIVEIPPEKE